MKYYYSTSNVVVFTGQYETYSIAFLEAAACNKIIITNEKLGIIDNLLKSYDELQLKKYGIYIYKNEMEIRNIIDEIVSKLENIIPTTRKFILENDLDEISCNRRLFKILISN
jgi:hypothetical protein